MIARPYLRPYAGEAPRALTPLQVAAAYDFPTATGVGQTIAIIELGGGWALDDLQAYFSGLGLAVPDVTWEPVGTGYNYPGGDANGADGEVLLDIEIAGAIAPGAKIVVYFGDNTDSGFLAAINAAIDATPTPCAISISWGGPETSWSRSALQQYDAAFARAVAKGIVVLAAAGDSGADDGTRRKVADFPASSPNVIACGGTRLELDGAGARASETVWDDGPGDATGGGYSNGFSPPAWQVGLGHPRRGIPDVSGNADPESGYPIIVDGQRQVIGGTSAVAPLYAGLVARLRELGANTAYLAEDAYMHPEAFVDITSGGNEGYQAGTGWDPASGLGVPVGTALLAALGGAPTPVPPPDEPPPASPGQPSPADIVTALLKVQADVAAALTLARKAAA